MKTAIFSLALLLMAMSHPLHADSRTNYFDRAESQRFGTEAERRNETTNWLDDAPVIQIQQFDLSALSELTDYGIHLESLESLAAEHLSQRKGRYQVEHLNDLTRQLTQHLQQQGLLLTRVYIPAQKISAGTLQLAVAKGELESIRVTNNRLYDERIIQKPLLAQTGKPVSRSTLDTAMLYVQQIPGYEYNATFAPGEQPGTTSIQISTVREKPLQASLGADNYGSTYTGRQRLYGNLAINNLTGNADQLTLGLMYALNPSNSLYGNIGYRYPYMSAATGNGGYVETSYVHNTYAIGKELENLDLTGDASTLAVSLTNNLVYRSHEQLIAQLNLEMKTARLKIQDLTLSEDRLTTLSAGLQWNTQDQLFGIPARSQIHTLLTQGLPGILNAQDDDTPNSRINAAGEYGSRSFTKARIHTSRVHYLNSNELKMTAQLHYSNDMLAPIEQTTLGGPYAVRGYTTSDFNADTALLLSAEYIGYSASVLSLPIDQLKAAVFIDYGAGWRNEALANETDNAELMAIGWYAEFIKDKKFNAKIHMGYPLSSAEPANGKSMQWYLSLYRSF